MQEGVKVVLIFVKVHKLLSDCLEKLSCVGCIGAEAVMYHHEVSVTFFIFAVDNAL